MAKRTVSGVGVLDKAMLVVDALGGGPATLADLVDRTGLARATAHRLASALEVHGLVARDGDGRFTLGPRFGAPTLAAAATRPLGRLRDETGESVQLYVREGATRRCVLALESPHSLRTIVPVGAVLPLDRGSAGRVLRGAREGWVESVEEREPGVASVSAAVRDGDGRVLAAVSVSGPIERTTRSPGRRYAKAVIACAAAIESALAP